MTEFHVEGTLATNNKKSPKRLIWNVFFSLMYPALIIFAIIITSFISITSILFGLVIKFFQLFKK